MIESNLFSLSFSHIDYSLSYHLRKNQLTIENIFFRFMTILPNCRRNKRIVSSLKVPFAAK